MSRVREDRSIGGLVVTHGRFAVDLVESARTIVGEFQGLEALSIDWNDDVQHATQQIEQARARVDQGRGVVLFTDMFGGTPTNLALSLLEPGRLEIITGVNLPMLIKFANLDSDLSLDQAADSIAGQGRESIRVASQLLAGTGEQPDKGSAGTGGKPKRKNPASPGKRKGPPRSNEEKP